VSLWPVTSVNIKQSYSLATKVTVYMHKYKWKWFNSFIPLLDHLSHTKGKKIANDITSLFS
jgi:hypothetical protein